MSTSSRARSRRIRRILANVAVALLALVALLLLVGLFLPRAYRVQRSVDMMAEPEVVFADLAGLRRWPEWTVWNKDLDPGLELRYGTPETGVGAEYSWVGPKLGNGTLKLTKANPTNGIWYDLSFDNGTMVSSGSITYEKVAGALRVTWVNEGDLGKNPVNRYFGLMMDSMVGPDFEKGLVRLKTRAESARK